MHAVATLDAIYLRGERAVQQLRLRGRIGTPAPSPFDRALLSGNAAWYVFSALGPNITPSDHDRTSDLFIRGPLPLS